jgi:putative ABC transport system substrate-binding protein
MIRRRAFLTLLGSAAAWPIAARAQQQALRVIGFLHAGAPEASAATVAAFREGLGEAGYVEGRNVSVEYRWANNQFGRLPELAADLVRLRVAIIATPSGTAAALAAKEATETIPIVFGVAFDPIRSGLVTSLNRPGGNVTGITYMSAELGSKRLGLLHELLPNAKRFAVLVNPTTPLTAILQDLQPVATEIGGEIEVLSAATNQAIDEVFANAKQKRIDALLLTANTLFTNRRVQIVTLSTRLGIPAIYGDRGAVEIGGLMSYGTDTLDQDRMTGVYVGRVLKGEKPADLPVMRATKFKFIINLQTAKTLGLAVPPTLLAIADEVIE